MFAFGSGSLTLTTMKLLQLASVAIAAFAAVGADGDCASPTLPAGSSSQQLRQGDKQRDYRVYVPSEHDAFEPAPLVLFFHGWTNSCDKYDGGCRDARCYFERHSDAKNFILVSVCGYRQSFNAGACCPSANSKEDPIDDVEFARNVVADVSKKICIDTRRVYAVGYSNGAMMSHRLACEAPDVFAAVAGVAGVTAYENDGTTAGIQICTQRHEDARQSLSRPVKAVSVLDIHGSKDPYVPLKGSLFMGFPSVHDSMVGWASRAKCTDLRLPATRQLSASWTSKSWEACDDNATVSLVVRDGGGHEWFEDYEENFHATEHILSFFEAAALRQYGIQPSQHRPLVIPTPEPQLATREGFKSGDGERRRGKAKGGPARPPSDGRGHRAGGRGGDVDPDFGLGQLDSGGLLNGLAAAADKHAARSSSTSSSANERRQRGRPVYMSGGSDGGGARWLEGDGHDRDEDAASDEFEFEAPDADHDRYRRVDVSSGDHDAAPSSGAGDFDFDPSSLADLSNLLQDLEAML